MTAPRRRRVLPPCGVALLLVGSLACQTQWTRIGPAPGARHSAAIAAVAGLLPEAVLFGGRSGLSAGGILGDTWSWDGTGWTREAPATSPGAREGHAMAADTLRGRVVLFGGLQASPNVLVGDTWEWDGTTWLQRSPATRPQARSGHAMAFDAARGRVVLFGGAAPKVRGGPLVALGDTWEFDGATWQRRVPATSPSPRQQHAMAYDPIRQRVVLFGGTSGGAETWEWDGTTWARQLPTIAPSARSGHAMTYDDARGHVVLFGGTTGGAETWEWDGSTWTRAVPTASPPARTDTSMFFDASLGRVVAFGGVDGAGQTVLGDTWELDDSTWTERPFAPVSPTVRRSHAMVYDSARDRIVLFGGFGGPFGTALNDTWEFDGTTWSQRIPGASPPSAREGHAMAYDSTRRRTVLFGGSANGVRNAETWEWDGANWLRFFPATNPPARDGHAMAYDALHRRVVMFGGNGGGLGKLGDTWEWDGTDWTQRFPASSPPARDHHALVFQSGRGRTFLLGGFAKLLTPLGPLVLDDWEWNGTTWIQQPPASGLPVSVGSSRDLAMAYDAARARVVVHVYQLFGNATFEWDGFQWFSRSPAFLGARLDHAMTFDAARQRVVLFGGTTAGPQLDDETWQYAPTNPASTTPVGAGCPGTTGQPILTLVGLPWLGRTLAVTVTGARPNAPAVLLHGLSNTSWLGLSLPFNLAVFGAPQCTLLESADYAPAVTTDSRGFGLVSIPVPNSPGLLGLPFYDQFAVADPGANAFGVALTAGAASRIGGL